MILLYEPHAYDYVVTYAERFQEFHSLTTVNKALTCIVKTYNHNIPPKHMIINMS